MVDLHVSVVWRRVDFFRDPIDLTEMWLLVRIVGVH
jgi:uncharacterized circularly permuted ATP-grasp superfamily protein